MHDAKLFLAGLLHVSIDDLEKALAATYERKTIPKRSSGTRTLFVPEKPLKFIQRRILRSLFCRIVLPHHFHGFRQKHSIVTNASEHKGVLYARYWLKVDLKDAFPSIKETHFRELTDLVLRSVPDFRSWRKLRISRILHRRYDCRPNSIDGWPNDECGICQHIESELTVLEKRNPVPFPDFRKLLRQFSKANPIFDERYRTWLNGSDSKWRQFSLFDEYRPKSAFEDFLRDIFEILLKLTFHRGLLPQGAPSSPYILNLSLWFSGLIGKLEELSITTYREGTTENVWQRKPCFQFTIYADDITFSSSSSFNNRPFAMNGDQRTVKGMILSSIEANGWYRVNPAKIHSFDFKKGYPLVTGLRVTYNKVGLSKKQIRWLRSFIYHAKSSSNPKVKSQLAGWSSYIRMVYIVRTIHDFHKVPRQIRDILVY